MLSELRIQGLGVIDDAVLDLHPGLNVVTGETGAGKTMVVTGLGLLLGARADAGLVRSGAGSAVVEGLVDVASDHPAALRAAEAGRRRRPTGWCSCARSSPRAAPAPTSGAAPPRWGCSARSASTSSPCTARPTSGGCARATSTAPCSTSSAERRCRRPCWPTPTSTTPTRPRPPSSPTCASRPATAPARSRCSSTVSSSSSRSTPSPARTPSSRVEDERLGHAEGLRGAAALAHDHLAGAEEYAAEPAPSVVELIASARQALAGEVDHDPALRELDRRLADLGYLAADLAADLSSYLPTSRSTRPGWPGSSSAGPTSPP